MSSKGSRINNGDGVVADPIEAYAWVLHASKSVKTGQLGIKEAQQIVRMMHPNGEKGSADEY